MAESRRSPSSDIYTVLMVVAFLVLVAGVGYVWYKASAVTGSANPFQVQQSDATLVVGGVEQLA